MGRAISLWAATLLAAGAFGQEFKLGSKVSDFGLRDVSGAPVAFGKLKGQVTVIGFIATQCPISNDYNGRMKALYTDYHPKGVHFVFINPNNTEPAGDVAQHTKQNGFPFAVYKDERNVVADRFGAEFTPEVFVVDSEGVIRYHGAIDDSRVEARVKAQSLRKALDAMLAGQSVEPARTRAFGCTIKRVKKTS
ncbi:MAG: redoxin domain-containing protein [Acidobacteria bacterium]|nr:redoxin domain-containing protein [Acidobacteriota bacterium]